MEDCIFCKICNGHIDSYKIYEDDEFLAILDRFPSALGHVLIIPKNHVPNIFEMEEAQGGRLFSLGVKISKAMNTVMDMDGMNVVQNNGVVAGQSVFHFHLHLIPRKKGDNVKICWNTLDPEKASFDRVVSDIKKVLTQM